MNERIRNEINVSNIIAIDYDEFERLCRKDNLQAFVFQYDNISVTVMTTISVRVTEELYSVINSNIDILYRLIDRS